MKHRSTTLSRALFPLSILSLFLIVSYYFMHVVSKTISRFEACSFKVNYCPKSYPFCLVLWIPSNNVSYNVWTFNWIGRLLNVSVILVRSSMIFLKLVLFWYIHQATFKMSFCEKSAQMNSRRRFESTWILIDWHNS